MELLAFLAPPFIAGLILTGIHAYLGLHVVERGVIFVDLSLAQIAALGATVATLNGHDVHDSVTYFWSLGFTIAGAAIFALTRTHQHKSRIPQEAIIGIVYAVSAATAILAMSKAPEGTEHLKDMLVGNILTVSWRTVIETAVVYSYLIVPSVAAMMYARTVGTRLAFGWSVGAIVSALGVFLSFHFDLPTGATIVATFGGSLALMALVRPFLARSEA
jgi:zinc/manganese transport system permease protein